MYYSGDPIADFNAWDRDMARQQRERELNAPKCCYCGEYILEDKALCIGDDWFCCCDKDCKEAAMEAMWEFAYTDYLKNVA